MGKIKKFLSYANRRAAGHGVKGGAKVRALQAVAWYRYVVSYKKDTENEYAFHREGKEKKRSPEKLYIRGSVQRSIKLNFQKLITKMSTHSP